MKRWIALPGFIAVLWVGVSPDVCRAAININNDMVTVGNAGNAADATGFGSVDHAYQIDKYEITAGQYKEFLNAVAATDTYGLYNSEMWSNIYGYKIQQNGSPGSFTYSVQAGYENRPVNYVSWGDAARFVNWMTNGQLSGAQDLTTTEAGSYYLNGAMTTLELGSAPRTATKYVIPSDNEWYKAAFYDPNKPGGAGYWLYPNGKDTITTSEANYGPSVGHTTPVGDYPSPSPYGTFDQGGNVWEWNGTLIDGSPFGKPSTSRGLRGAGFLHEDLYLSTSTPAYTTCQDPTWEYYDVGFRVGSLSDNAVPEPSTLIIWSLLGVCGMGVGWWRRKRAA